MEIVNYMWHIRLLTFSSRHTSFIGNFYKACHTPHIPWSPKDILPRFPSPRESTTSHSVNGDIVFVNICCFQSLSMLDRVHLSQPSISGFDHHALCSSCHPFSQLLMSLKPCYPGVSIFFQLQSFCFPLFSAFLLSQQIRRFLSPCLQTFPVLAPFIKPV